LQRRCSFAAPACLRRHVDDATTEAIPYHQPRYCLQDEKDALHIDLEQAFEVLRRDVQERSHVEDRRVVDENVDPAGALGRFVGRSTSLSIKAPGATPKKVSFQSELRLARFRRVRHTSASFFR
jgi:hypothetical protein